MTALAEPAVRFDPFRQPLCLTQAEEPRVDQPSAEPSEDDQDWIIAEWRAGRNTHEISQSTGVPEPAVAAVVRAERERRLGEGCRS